MTKFRDIDEVPCCEHCSQDFDQQLPDMDEHRYECCSCKSVVCFNCRASDDTGNDFCPDDECEAARVASDEEFGKAS